MNALANADDHNPVLDFFYRLDNSIPYGDTPDDNNGDNAGDITWVEEWKTKRKSKGATTPDYKEEIPAIKTPEEEEKITELDIPEEEDENTEITGVDQNT